MEFSFHQPPPSLASSVKAIWCARGLKAEFDTPEPIVPDGCVEIVFNLGDWFISADTGRHQPRALLAGQMTRPVVALPAGDVDLIGIRFRTGRAGATLRLSMWQTQDQLIDAGAVLRDADRLVDELGNAPAERRLAHLSIALAERFHVVDEDSTSAVDHALAVIGASRGTVAIEQVAGRVGITRRHLERRFREQVGLGAKHVARISRIHAVLELLQQQPAMSGAEIAASCGYSDQAHLIRECQQLTGKTPQRLKSSERSLAALMREAV